MVVRLNNPTMCADTTRAAQNRQRVVEGYGDAFYLKQAHAVAQWPLGEPKPSEVIIGDLPFVGKTGKHSKRYDYRED
jgi:hypothetical protein